MSPKRSSRNQARVDSFFSKPLEWSVWKHQTLEKYLRIWIYKLGSAHRRLAFIDTNAGAGRYEDGSKGSPIIAAEWNGKAVGSQTVWLDVHACEVRDAERNQLKKNLEFWTQLQPPRAFIYESPFWEVLAEIVDVTRATPSLFFVDPYSVTDVAFDKLGPLLDDRKRASTEVLVRVDPVMFCRMTGWLEDRERSPRSARAAASFRNLLTKFNIDPEAISAAKQDGQYPEQSELLAKYLERFRNRFRWVQLIPIRPSYWAAPKYYLVHGTDSAHGAAFINDAVSTNEDSLYEDTVEADDRRIGQLALFGAERKPRSSLAALRDTAREILSAAPMNSLSFVELRARLAIVFGSEFREKHHKAAVNALIGSGEAFIVAGDRLVDESMLRLR